MSRPKIHNKDTLVESAMQQFWLNGYEATSIDDLIKATGASRHALYSELGSKRDLYLEGFAAYQRLVVTPAISTIEAEGARLEAISAFFEIQISLAELSGFPGPGCFVANATTETAPHDDDVRAAVDAHLTRLRSGFRNALRSTDATEHDMDALADFLTVSAQGLWAMSRVVDSAAPLRSYVKTLMTLITQRISDDKSV